MHASSSPLPPYPSYLPPTSMDIMLHVFLLTPSLPHKRHCRFAICRYIFGREQKSPAVQYSEINAIHVVFTCLLSALLFCLYVRRQGEAVLWQKSYSLFLPAYSQESEKFIHWPCQRWKEQISSICLSLLLHLCRHLFALVSQDRLFAH